MVIPNFLRKFVRISLSFGFMPESKASFQAFWKLNVRSTLERELSSEFSLFLNVACAVAENSSEAVSSGSFSKERFRYASKRKAPSLARTTLLSLASPSEGISGMFSGIKQLSVPSDLPSLPVRVKPRDFRCVFAASSPWNLPMKNSAHFGAASSKR